MVYFKQKCSAKTSVEPFVNNIIVKRGLGGVQTVEDGGDPANYYNCNVAGIRGKKATNIIFKN